MSDKKPTRRVLVSYKGAAAVVHWGRYLVPTEPKTPTDRLWLIGGGKHWVPDCDQRYSRYSPTAAPPSAKYAITCKKCIEAWGNGVRKKA